MPCIWVKLNRLIFEILFKEAEGSSGRVKKNKSKYVDFSLSLIIQTQISYCTIFQFLEHSAQPSSTTRQGGCNFRHFLPFFEGGCSAV